LQISCPHIERACTSAYYADRKLMVPEIVQAAASAIQVFTGNNVAPKGDLASRALQVRLTVDRPDPENRQFEHQDPLGWTRANRTKILQALYTIALGNPEAMPGQKVRIGTRFKRWQLLVGSAVEYAAKCAGDGNPDNRPGVPDFDADQAHEVDFVKLFLESVRKH
jgi:hypothetical protein